jgi:hypothetical protein
MHTNHPISAIQFQPCKLLLIPGDRVFAHFFVLLLIVVHAFEVEKNHNNRGGLDSNRHWIEWKCMLHTALGMQLFLLHSTLSGNCYTMNVTFAIN